MSEIIPVDRLNALSKNGKDDLWVFFLDGKIENPQAAINVPFRRNFYTIGVCLRGSAGLKADLETNHISPNTLITSPPQTINQWTYMSDDFETLSVLFTRNFISENNNLDPDQFQFFEGFARHGFQMSGAQSGNVINALRFLKAKYDEPHLYRDKILSNLISNLLFEIAVIYDQHDFVKNPVQTRNQMTFTEFKKLVNLHSTAERSVRFYAEKLLITSKHLSETVGEVTGKTAGDWITEAVILEAKILLQNPNLTISQISDLLRFSDSSTFARFFKKNAGLAPTAYKHSF